MIREWCFLTPRGVRITVQVTPNAKKNEITGVQEEVLKIRLHAQPIDGKANEALIRYLADCLDISKSAISITHGHTGRRKVIEITDARLTPAKVGQILCLHT